MFIYIPVGFFFFPSVEAASVSAAEKGQTVVAKDGDMDGWKKWGQSEEKKSTF